MSASQFSPIVGLMPSADSAMQNSGAQSQPGTLSQPNIFSSASIFSPSSSESLTQDVTHSDDREENEDDLEISQRICQEFEDIFGKAPNFSIFDLKLSTISVREVVGEYSTQDFSPLLSQEPPASKRTKNWINDALDQAGYKMEIYLFQAIKAAPIGLAEIPTSKEEARTVRIQGRFGFRAATLMSTDASTGILTERQELILREARQEANLFGDTTGPQRSQEDSNSEEGGARAVGAGDQGGFNNFRSSSQGDRAEEANRRKNSIVYLGMEANRRREIDKQRSAGHVEEQTSQKISQPSAVQRRSVASQPIKDPGIQDDI
ncbi:uncharacterized protein MONOS_11391 [Monocercomonoides exilis]|uniref:uncharacterized protein n=1 Tax=Monocercomonoides exilis TaxID=2049356 RepID=UPI00355A07CB|nr:hypothetical protein MONOS_11391 [Monocercomonoides exilis]|eukprot:MONOS_11391.1-p1 / transcript=MONOS_11391.1 / gene=MONOS_11391 / organism=Monocercomonoides_exilis_PA203 / gene_product=unspecified product / transcript_product=unspecified product / location=Mono_scaffold00569:4123-5257(-) / protein_length=320 / sequence_SO=supercontig / SO=protein_coding / is_pseudo=false